MPGLSPRVRGNQGEGSAVAVSAGSIPAGAGEPCAAASTSGWSRVYPRGCGGTSEGWGKSELREGLSPRVRGNHAVGHLLEGTAGSIPAGAGEPGAQQRLVRDTGVYPRGCGGTAEPRTHGKTDRGLSPRVRGNLGRDTLAGLRIGSIPAGAGEPNLLSATGSHIRVYPRGCGGTPFVSPMNATPMGLSPRVRGNQHGEGRPQPGGGSIPAGAGEPLSDPLHNDKGWVYPRGCGGTSPAPWLQVFDRGLSPRVRGNRPQARLPLLGLGSIPAGAGEPHSPILRVHQSRVYPRGCGGTRIYTVGHGGGLGLSPRVRGNRHSRTLPPDLDRSIPAGAGEPFPCPWATGESGVYPRGCGGTTGINPDGNVARGLSPRVRGNPREISFLAVPEGSIPAGAGEPDR